MPCLLRTNLADWGGRRDHALLLTLYNTGARVSEMTELYGSKSSSGSRASCSSHGQRAERAGGSLVAHNDAGSSVVALFARDLGLAF